ncbi:MAG: hypothetical protein AAFW47_06030, partial [Pseudomonadota bacterium]
MALPETQSEAGSVFTQTPSLSSEDRPLSANPAVSTRAVDLQGTVAASRGPLTDAAALGGPIGVGSDAVAAILDPNTPLFGDDATPQQRSLLNLTQPEQPDLQKPATSSSATIVSERGENGNGVTITARIAENDQGTIFPPGEKNPDRGIDSKGFPDTDDLLSQQRLGPQNPGGQRDNLAGGLRADIGPVAFSANAQLRELFPSTFTDVGVAVPVGPLSVRADIEQLQLNPSLELQVGY